MTKLMFGKLAATILQGVGSADSYALGKPPTPPAEFALPQPRGGWGMLGNDTAGDCVAEGTLVCADRVSRGYRGRYSGPMVTISFDSGKRLTVTPNHAVLTPIGFRRACTLQEGDYAISASGPQVLGVGSQDIHIDHAPAPIEQVAQTLLRRGAGAGECPKASVVVRPVDFHGDGAFMDSYIDVVRPHGLLDDQPHATLSEPERQRQVGARGKLEGGLHGAGAPLERALRRWSPALGDVGISRQRAALALRHDGIPQPDGFAYGAGGISGSHQEAFESFGMDADLTGEFNRPLSRRVASKERLHVWQSALPVAGGSVAAVAQRDTSGAYPTRDGLPSSPNLARDLIRRGPGLVQADQIVGVERHSFTGHVYDLSTESGWYIAGGIVTHNCTIAGAAHLIEAVESQLPFVNQVEFTTDQAIRQYSEITGYDPATGQNDTGCNENAVLELWRTQGLFTGHRIAAHAPVPINDVLAVHRAIAFYGGCYIGIACPQSAQQQFQDGKPWTVVPGSPIVGGHCIVPVAYDPEGIDCVTWGGIARVTWPWWVTYADEVHCVITDSEVQVRTGVGAHPLDLAALRADLDRLA